MKERVLFSDVEEHVGVDIFSILAGNRRRERRGRVRQREGGREGGREGEGEEEKGKRWGGRREEESSSGHTLVYRSPLYAVCNMLTSCLICSSPYAAVKRNDTHIPSHRYKQCMQQDLPSRALVLPHAELKQESTGITSHKTWY